MVNPEKLIQSIDAKKLPPVELWNPPYCGEMDLVIKANGEWLYQGTPMTRLRMRQLFSRIIKKEGDDYFLVTPVEKVRIRVEWQPFVLVDFNQVQQNDVVYYEFVDSLGQTIRLDAAEQLVLADCPENFLSEAELTPNTRQKLPLITVRRNLMASLSRACYYRLVESAEMVELSDRYQVQIVSGGITFVLGEIFDAGDSGPAS